MEQVSQQDHLIDVEMGRKQSQVLRLSQNVLPGPSAEVSVRDHQRPHQSIESNLATSARPPQPRSVPQRRHPGAAYEPTAISPTQPARRQPERRQSDRSSDAGTDSR